MSNSERRKEAEDWKEGFNWEQIREWYSAGMQTDGIADLTAEEATDRIGKLIDAAELLDKEDGLKHALELIDQVLEGAVPPRVEAQLHYFAGNAYSALWEQERNSRRVPRHRGWDIPEVEPIILHLRRAANHSGFDELPVERRCQILTNLGRALNMTGRSIEAISCYDRALRLAPSFGMARGKRASTTGLYAAMFYNRDHARTFYRFAYADLATAASDEGRCMESDAPSAFRREQKRLEAVVGDADVRNEVPNLYNHGLGETSEERAYRRWCLHHRLFLNPMNDLGPYPIAARDVLHTPPIVTDIHTGPKYQGAFNQLKQGFVSARYLLYEGIRSNKPHFSDRDVLLYNTLDHPSYSLAVEKMKFAFRSFYSLFDQIGFLLNDYLGLGIPHCRIKFRTLWYENRKQSQGIRDDLLQRQNRPLQALFWLSKDLHERRDDFRAAIEPEARRLAIIRNHLEHRYLKVHDMWMGEPKSKTLRAVRYDELAESISRSDFRAKTLHLASLARSALVYLSLAMHVENVTVRKKDRDGTVIPIPRALGTWDDEWKR